MAVIAVPKKSILIPALAVGASIGAGAIAIPAAYNAIRGVAANPILPWLYRTDIDKQKLEELRTIASNTAKPEQEQSITIVQLRQQKINDYRSSLLDTSNNPKPDPGVAWQSPVSAYSQPDDKYRQAMARLRYDNAVTTHRGGQ